MEKKQELMLRSTDLKDTALAHQIARFVSDDNETIRFLAFDAALHQQGDEILSEALFTQLLDEESIRIPQKVVPEIVGRHDFVVPDELRDAVDGWLSKEYGVHKEGYVYRHRR